MAVSIVLDGPEGVGKTTVQRILVEMFKHTPDRKTLFVREPGGTTQGEIIRQMLLKGEGAKNMDPTAGLHLFTAARTQLLNSEINPFREKNPDGIQFGDRSWFVTLALQANDGVDEELIRQTQAPFMSRYPDLIVYIDLPAEESMVRTKANANFSGETNWRDQVELERFKSDRIRYLKLVQEFRPRVMVVNGMRSPFDIAYEIRDISLRMLAERHPEYREHALEDLGLLSIDQVRDMEYEWMNNQTNPKKLIFEEQEQIRQELGFPSKQELETNMLVEWQEMGIQEGRLETLDGLLINKERER